MNSDIKDLIKLQGPKHVAIIMDGNGRWAKKKDGKRTDGHKAGAERVIDIVRKSNDLGIKYLSLYAFSTENWKRPQLEVSTIMDLLVSFIKRELDEMNKNNVKLSVMGDASRLPLASRKAVQYAINKTKNNDGLILNIGLNYGARDELVMAVKEICRDYKNEKITLKDIDEQMISDKLYTSSMPDPDLMIRTGGEMRLSNFMLYQLAYAELYVTDTLWPDFTQDHYERAIIEFMGRNRRFGGLNEE